MPRHPFRTIATALATLSAGGAILVIALWLVAIARPGKYLHKSLTPVGPRVHVVGTAFVLDAHALWMLRQPTDYSTDEADAMTRNGTLFDGWRYQPEFVGNNRELARPFAFSIDRRGTRVPRFGVVFTPLWLPLAATSVAPLLWLVARWRRNTQRLNGRCVTCGYDLRASTVRCPECGTAVLHADAVA